MQGFFDRQIFLPNHNEEPSNYFFRNQVKMQTWKKNGNSIYSKWFFGAKIKSSRLDNIIATIKKSEDFSKENKCKLMISDHNDMFASH